MSESSTQTPPAARSIPVGAWIALGFGAVLMLAAFALAGVIAFGALDPLRATSAAPVAKKDASGCATWPLCPPSAAPSPSASPSYVAQQPLVSADVPLTAQMPYDGFLRADLPPDWKLMPDSHGDRQHYRILTLSCELTIDHTDGAAQPGSDRDQADAVLADRFAGYQADKKLSQLKRRPLASQWVPVVGSSARVEFETEQVDYVADSGNFDATESDVAMVRVIASKGETVYADLQCPTGSPGNMPTSIVSQAFGALSYQER